MLNGSTKIATGSVANGKGLHVNEENISKLQMMFIETYSSPVTPVREIVVNGVEASNGTQTELDITTHDSGLLPGSGNVSNTIITVTDHGDGMTREFVDNYFLGVGYSTKDNDPDGVGGFGIGAKSVMSVTDNAIWRTVHNGKKTVLIMTHTGEDIETNIETVDTDEPNGTTVTMPVGGQATRRIINRINHEFIDWQSPKDVKYTLNGVEQTVGALTNEKIASLPAGSAAFASGHSFGRGGRYRHDGTEITVLAQGNVPYTYVLRDFKPVLEHCGLRSEYIDDIVVRINLTRKNITPNRESLIQSDALEEKITDTIAKSFHIVVDEYLDRLDKTETFRDWMLEADKCDNLIANKFTPENVFDIGIARREFGAPSLTFEKMLSGKFTGQVSKTINDPFGSDRSVNYKAFMKDRENFSNLGISTIFNTKLLRNTDSIKVIPERFRNEFPEDILIKEADYDEDDSVAKARNDKFIAAFQKITGMEYVELSDVRETIKKEGQRIRKENGEFGKNAPARVKAAGIDVWSGGKVHQALAPKDAAKLLLEAETVYSIDSESFDLSQLGGKLGEFIAKGRNIAIITEKDNAVSRVKGAATRSGKSLKHISGWGSIWPILDGFGIGVPRIYTLNDLVNAYDVAENSKTADGSSVMEYIMKNNSDVTEEVIQHNRTLRDLVVKTFPNYADRTVYARYVWSGWVFGTLYGINRELAEDLSASLRIIDNKKRGLSHEALLTAAFTLVESIGTIVDNAGD